MGRVGTTSFVARTGILETDATFPMEERGFDKQLQTAENHYCP